MWRKGNASALLVQIQTRETTMESTTATPQTIKNGSAFWPSNPTSEIHPKEPKTLIQKNMSTIMFIAVLFSIAKIWKQPTCPSVDDRIKQLRDILHSVVKKKLLPIVTEQMDLENISEISQSEKDKYHMISLLCGL